MTAEEFNIKLMPMRPRLLFHAAQLCGDADTAEDIVQEAMLRLWEQRDTLASHPNAEALAMTIVRHRWTDMCRHRQMEQRLEAPQLGGQQPEGAGDIELIGLIIDSLPPLQQQIFRMKEVDGYTKEEIIQITGCSDESLRQNLSRARRKIREQYIKLSGL